MCPWPPKESVELAFQCKLPQCPWGRGPSDTSSQASLTSPSREGLTPSWAYLSSRSPPHTGFSTCVLFQGPPSLPKV